jgi:hypothetical protein
MVPLDHLWVRSPPSFPLHFVNSLVDKHGNSYDDLSTTSDDALYFFQQFAAAQMVAAEKGAYVLPFSFLPSSSKSRG